jgi:ABC-type Mn2+/Zn2+ transport system permease subunit
MIFEILQYGFMQRALISGIAIAINCSAIGLFLVLRRQSLFGNALSHVAFGGIVFRKQRYHEFLKTQYKVFFSHPNIS